MTALASCAEAWSPARCLAYARFAYGCIYGDDEVGGGQTEAFTWRHEPAFAVDRIIDGLDLAARAQWMRDEIANDDEEGAPRGYRDMVGETIEEAIVVVIVGGLAYCWDGNHRIGACCLGDVATLPAIVGTPYAI